VRASDQELDALEEDRAPLLAGQLRGGQGTFAGSSVESTRIRSLRNVNDGTDLGFGLAALTGPVMAFSFAWFRFWTSEIRQLSDSIAAAFFGSGSAASSPGLAAVYFIVACVLWSAIVFAFRSWHRHATNVLPLRISVILLGLTEMSLVRPLLNGLTVVSVYGAASLIAAIVCAGALYVLAPKALRS
jgi:hypothetical protein